MLKRQDWQFVHGKEGGDSGSETSDDSGELLRVAEGVFKPNGCFGLFGVSYKGCGSTRGLGRRMATAAARLLAAAGCHEVACFIQLLPHPAMQIVTTTYLPRTAAQALGPPLQSVRGRLQPLV
jgi:hypothetical protein